MKLNLGSKDTSIPGFKNVDMVKYSTVDIVSDVSKLDKIRNGSVEELYASHILEHFPHENTLDILKVWYKKLKKGGILYLAVPDFDALVRMYLKTNILCLMIIQILNGRHDQPYFEHKATFNYPRILYMLNKTGFKDIRKVERFPFYLKDASNLQYYITGDDISLNVIAVK